ncbi:phosphonate metabolism protein [Roseivivax halodurans JCM 10272]|uniref:Phosphonate metabolism protein n=1 Tax=Roseivivax halodurans JCM 10272 TaxID=1449350 RepID=X7EFU0_9RHOB|nr:DUF1045 domain-containing protein [Roseivivax halodurans]ETX14924.1 phosphonate metabolism protein [Roseivivax halodurans JCM 10272]
MTDYKRFAIYYAPEPGAFADFGARWLGWDAATGEPREHPDVPGLPRPVAELTDRPRKYGLHATMKPPFRLAPYSSQDALAADIGDLAAAMSPVSFRALKLVSIGPFLALVPDGDPGPLEALAGAAVSRLDAHRAAPSAEELARRRKASLSMRQDRLLETWGYPYVMEEFRFHITLTGPLPQEERGHVREALGHWIDPVLPQPFVIGSICLFGEAQDGFFHLLHRFDLTG